MINYDQHYVCLLLLHEYVDYYPQWHYNIHIYIGSKLYFYFLTIYHYNLSTILRQHHICLLFLRFHHNLFLIIFRYKFCCHGINAPDFLHILLQFPCCCLRILILDRKIRIESSKKRIGRCLPLSAFLTFLPG